ncbi:hypothetical protein DIPPA_63743 [Diplonema papillatum]|nr:hypothetical protein DIPPA_63743 [Diplonema papillatum]
MYDDELSYSSYLKDEIRKTQQDNEWLREQISSTRHDSSALRENRSARRSPHFRQSSSRGDNYSTRSEHVYDRDSSYRNRHNDRDDDTHSRSSYQSHRDVYAAIRPMAHRGSLQRSVVDDNIATYNRDHRDDHSDYISSYRRGHSSGGDRDGGGDRGSEYRKPFWGKSCDGWIRGKRASEHEPATESEYSYYNAPDRYKRVAYHNQLHHDSCSDEEDLVSTPRQLREQESVSGGTVTVNVSIVGGKCRRLRVDTQETSMAGFLERVLGSFEASAVLCKNDQTWCLARFSDCPLLDLGIADGDNLVIEYEKVPISAEIEGIWQGSGGIRLRGGARVGGQLQVELDGVDMLRHGTLEWYSVTKNHRQLVDSNVLTFVPANDDLGAHIQVEYENGQGSVSTVASPPVVLLPWVQNAEIHGSLMSGTALNVTYNVSGGDCTTAITWQSVNNSRISPIGSGPNLNLTHDHIGSRIQCVITPIIKKTGAHGISCTVQHPDSVKPETLVVHSVQMRWDETELLPGTRIELLADVSQGQDLTAPMITWTVGVNVVEGPSYWVNVTDLGKRLECTYQARTSSGVVSKVATATLFIPQIELTNVTLTGASVPREIITCVVDDHDTRPDDFTWSVSPDGWNWNVTQSGLSDQYEVSVDDVGCFLRCVAGGVAHIRPCVFITIDNWVARSVADTISNSGVKGFNVETVANNERQHLILTNRYLKLMIASSKEVIFKKKWSLNMRVVSSPQNVRSLVIHADAKSSFEVLVQGAAERSELLTSFRCFHAVGMSAMCREVFGVEVSPKTESRSVCEWSIVNNSYEDFIVKVITTLIDNPASGAPPTPEFVAMHISSQKRQGVGWFQAWQTITALSRSLS